MRRPGIIAAAFGTAIVMGPQSVEGIEVDHAPFDELLARYVAEDGVRYLAWSESEADRQALKEYVGALEGVQPAELPDDEALAFWINAYNAVTLSLVLDHYPVASIKDIDDPWKQKLVTIDGQELSLDEIEHEILRKNWTEPRIHFALNCASKSCPPLRQDAYSGARIHEQLEEQTVAFIADPSNGLDKKGRLRLSKIFRWYAQDFVGKDRKVLDWLASYIPELEGREKPPRIIYQAYSWKLNEAAPD